MSKWNKLASEIAAARADGFSDAEIAKWLDLPVEEIDGLSRRGHQ